MYANKHRGFYKHGNLPHLDAGGSVQFVTFVLADAAPKQQLSRNSLGLGVYSDEDMWSLDGELDRGRGECLLAREEIAGIVKRSILLRENETHQNLAWVIMPNHVHLLLRQMKGFTLGNVLKQIKGGSSPLINEHIGRTGKVWQIGYFDRLIRNPQHLRQTVDYIHLNPVNAGLTKSEDQWNMSSSLSFNPAIIAEILGLPNDWYSEV